MKTQFNRLKAKYSRHLSKRLVLSSLVLFIACQKIQIRETRYSTGKTRNTTQYVIGTHSEIILHGAQIEWFPSGQKASMERFIAGIQQGYAFKWYPNGKLKSIVFFQGVGLLFS